ncbi:TPA: glycosyltransferase [Streptococcus suis]|nr:glycosyltransferase [Streptococcus suis]HEP1835553.1 glycosyltransferase [Streptococcus suis]
MTVYTVRRFLTNQVFGYETTQSYRHKTLSKYRIPNKFLVTTPFFREQMEQRLWSMGFEPENVVILPSTYSDMDPKTFTYSFESFEQSLEVGTNLLNATQFHRTYKVIDGYLDVNMNHLGKVVRILRRNGNLKVISQTFCTEGPYFTSYHDEVSSFEYYNLDGSVAISGYYQNLKVSTAAVYILNGEEIREEDLVIRYLEEYGLRQDVLLNDQLQFKFPKLMHYAETNGFIYREILHYNHFHMLEVSSKYKTIIPEKIITASPYLNQRLLDEGHDATFIHPVGVTVAQNYPTGLSSNKVLLVGNFHKLKRIEMALQAFQQVPELELHVYGGTTPEITEFKNSYQIPDNVVFEGSVDSSFIPRSTYAAYLSCSKTEMYANAMVECLGVGLIPILSKVDYGHNQVLEKLDYGTGFDTVEELIEVLRKFVAWPTDYRKQISEKVLNIAQEFSHEEAESALLNWLKKVGSRDVE